MSLRSIAGVLVGLGVIRHRVCRSMCRVRGCFCQVHPSNLSSRRAFKPSAGSAFLATVAILFFAAIHVPGDDGRPGCKGGSRSLKLIGLGAFALSGLSIGWRNWANLDDLKPLMVSWR